MAPSPGLGVPGSRKGRAARCGRSTPISPPALSVWSSRPAGNRGGPRAGKVLQCLAGRPAAQASTSHWKGSGDSRPHVVPTPSANGEGDARGGAEERGGRGAGTYRRGCGPAWCPVRCRRAGSAGGSRCGSRAACGAGCRAGAPAPQPRARRGRPAPPRPGARPAEAAAPRQEAAGSASPPAGPSPPGRPGSPLPRLREPWGGRRERRRIRKTKDPQ